jgi:hypothetical protein
VILASVAVSLVALSLVEYGGRAEARQQRALPPASKPVLPYLLSDPRVVAEMQKRFSVSGAEKEKMLAAVRLENRSIAAAYGRSERVVRAGGRQPMARTGNAIAVSSYNRQVGRSEAQARSQVIGSVPASRRPAFRQWLGGKWTQAVRQNCGGYTSLRYVSKSSPGVTDKVFATQYNGYTRFEVALPHRVLKDKGGFRVRLSYNGHRVWAPVKEVGPWNIHDNYWQSRKYRTMWRSLPRGVPEAKAAYCRNYNGGKDEFGRNVANPAGIDITPAVAHRLGLRTYQNARITVYYPWVGH